MGQFYYQLCTEMGKTMRELGEMEEEDPLGLLFLVFALSEKNRRQTDGGGR